MDTAKRSVGSSHGVSPRCARVRPPAAAAGDAHMWGRADSAEAAGAIWRLLARPVPRCPQRKPRARAGLSLHLPSGVGSSEPTCPNLPIRECLNWDSGRWWSVAGGRRAGEKKSGRGSGLELRLDGPGRRRRRGAIPICSGGFLDHGNRPWSPCPPRCAGRDQLLWRRPRGVLERAKDRHRGCQMSPRAAALRPWGKDPPPVP
jgi:hypothetical protein